MMMLGVAEMVPRGRLPNEHEAMVAMEIMVRRQIDDGALLRTNAVTADRQLYFIKRNEGVCP